jgi:excisionase family DNA binding protein
LAERGNTGQHYIHPFVSLLIKQSTFTNMNNLTFNELPNAIGLLHDKLSNIELLLAQGTNAQVSTMGKPFNTKELCRFLGISEPTCIRWRKKGKIPFLKVGGSIRYDKAAVIAAIESRKGSKS